MKPYYKMPVRILGTKYKGKRGIYLNKRTVPTEDNHDYHMIQVEGAKKPVAFTVEQFERL